MKITLDGSDSVPEVPDIKQVELVFGERRITLTPRSLWEALELAFAHGEKKKWEFKFCPPEQVDLYAHDSWEPFSVTLSRVDGTPQIWLRRQIIARE